MERDADTGRDQPSSAFAIRLKQLRVLRGYRTARAFAQALQIDENRYTRWERGEVEPSVAMLGKMADILNVPVDMLVSGGDVAANLAPSFGARETGSANSHVPGIASRSPAAGFHEEPSRFTFDKSPQELSQNLLVASRVHLMSLLERRVATFSQAEIDALIAKLTADLSGSATTSGLNSLFLDK
jgi:transcriptional regulator with XRE-family HTH domain